MGLPVEVVGLVTGIYRIIDQIHTATNATGDLVIATCIAHTEGQLDREILESDNLNYEQTSERESINA
jgi:Na+/H+-dicarboxylate symporter